MARVHRDHEVGLLLEDGTEETLEPLVGRRGHVGLEQAEAARTEPPGDGKGETERGAARGHAVEGHGDALGEGRRMTGADEGEPGRRE